MQERSKDVKKGKVMDGMIKTTKKIKKRMLGKYVNERVASPFAVLQSKTCVDYFRINEHKFAQVIAAQVAGWPLVMNNFDYRFDKSDTMCRTLDTHFSHLFYDGRNGTKGYDLIYNRFSRVSVKMQDIIFQRPFVKDPEKLTAPRDLVLRNRLGRGHHVFNREDYFDYLFAIQTNHSRCDNLLKIRFALAKFNTVENYIIVSNSDQVKCRIPNNRWDYLSDLHIFEVDTKDVEFEEKKNDLYQAARDNLAGELSFIGRKHITHIEG